MSGGAPHNPFERDFLLGRIALRHHGDIGVRPYDKFRLFRMGALWIGGLLVVLEFADRRIRRVTTQRKRDYIERYSVEGDFRDRVRAMVDDRQGEREEIERLRRETAELREKIAQLAAGRGLEAASTAAEPAGPSPPQGAPAAAAAAATASRSDLPAVRGDAAAGPTSAPPPHEPTAPADAPASFGGATVPLWRRAWNFISDSEFRAESAGVDARFREVQARTRSKFEQQAAGKDQLRPDDFLSSGREYHTQNPSGKWARAMDDVEGFRSR